MSNRTRSGADISPSQAASLGRAAARKAGAARDRHPDQHRARAVLAIDAGAAVAQWRLRPEDPPGWNG